MSKCWIIGRETTLPNGHKYAAEPYMAFPSEQQALQGKAMIEKVSGEKVRVVEAAYYDEDASDV